DLGAGLVDRARLVRVEDAERRIRPRRGPLDEPDPADEIRQVVDRPTRDREVDEGPRRVDAPVRVGGDRQLAERVALDALRARLREVRVVEPPRLEIVAGRLEVAHRRTPALRNSSST